MRSRSRSWISGRWRAWATCTLRKCCTAAASIRPRAAIACAATSGRGCTRRWRPCCESAIEHEGSTLSDGTYRNALNQAGRVPEPASGLRQGRRELPDVRPGHDPAHRAGPAIDVFLSGVPDRRTCGAATPEERTAWCVLDWMLTRRPSFRRTCQPLRRSPTLEENLHLPRNLGLMHVEREQLASRGRHATPVDDYRPDPRRSLPHRSIARPRLQPQPPHLSGGTIMSANHRPCPDCEADDSEAATAASTAATF